MFYLFVFCVLDTPLQGMKKRELDDDLVPSQLWIIAPSTPQGAYTLQNANGRSYATIHEGGFQSSSFEALFAKFDFGVQALPQMALRSKACSLVRA